jgi:hypothetical protein
MLGNAKDPERVRAVLSKLVPEIDKAVSSVDGLIADVMEVGSTSTQLIQEATTPEALIEATLGETFRVYSKSDISISYDLKHLSAVYVHVQKVSRVFSNIFGNAAQAMNYKGNGNYSALGRCKCSARRRDDRSLGSSRNRMSPLATHFVAWNYSSLARKSGIRPENRVSSASVGMMPCFLHVER